MPDKLESAQHGPESYYDQIRSRLESTDRILHGDAYDSPERVHEVLLARARALSQSVEREIQEKSVVVLVFRLGDQRYGVPLVQVVEIQSFDQYALVPNTPGFVKGVISVRGQIFTVVDLGVYFSVQGCDSERSSGSVLIVEGSGGRVGLLVDDVVGIAHYQPTEIHNVKLNLPTIKSEYITGTTSDSVAILNLGELLSDRKLLVEDE